MKMRRMLAEAPGPVQQAQVESLGVLERWRAVKLARVPRAAQSARRAESPERLRARAQEWRARERQEIGRAHV